MTAVPLPSAQCVCWLSLFSFSMALASLAFCRRRLKFPLKKSRSARRSHWIPRWMRAMAMCRLFISPSSSGDERLSELKELRSNAKKRFKTCGEEKKHSTQRLKPAALLLVLLTPFTKSVLATPFLKADTQTAEAHIHSQALTFIKHFLQNTILYVTRKNNRNYSYFFQLHTHILSIFHTFHKFQTNPRIAHKMQNASHLVQNESLHSKYHKRISKANISNTFAII